MREREKEREFNDSLETELFIWLLNRGSDIVSVSKIFVKHFPVVGHCRLYVDSDTEIMTKISSHGDWWKDC